MIPLVLTQLAARWGQALTLLVLSAAVTAAAVSALVYADAVDRAAIAQVLADSDPRDRVASFPVASQSGAGDGPSVVMEDYAVALAEMPSYVPVITTQIGVQGLREEALSSEVHRMLGRDGFCQHVIFEAGRCPVGSREAALPVALAEDTDRGPGDVVVLTPVVRVESAVVPDGDPVEITLTGVFEARDPTDPYWDAALDPLGHRSGLPAVLTNRTVLQTWSHQRELFYADAVLPASALTPDRIQPLRAQLGAANARTGMVVGSSISGELITDIPALLDRITAQGEQARALLPITAAPLVALGWLVVYLAVGHGVAARRREIGVVVLRGAKARTRWTAVATESLAPVLVGAPVGIVLAHLLVAVAGPARPQLAVDSGQLTAAGMALAGAVVAVLVALRQELAAPVAQLLRRVPPRRRLAVATAEVLAVAVAVVIVADLRAFDRELVGLMIIAPAAVMLAVAVLVARLVRPLINLAGRWSLRRGRLGPALAALYLARQPSAARLVVVLALVLGMLGFAVVSADVAGQGRAAEAARTLGAARVLTVQQPDASWLLATVREADPSGRYAMAVVGAPGTGQAGPRLAVDATRLAQVATWSDRYGELVAGEVADILRPPAPDPILVDNGELVAELSLAGSFTVDGMVTVSVLLAPTGAPTESVSFAPLTAGESTYRAEVTNCEDGCRLVGLTAETTDESSRPGGPVGGGRFSFQLHGLELDGRDLLPGEWLSMAGQWRPPAAGTFQEHITISVDGDGLRFSHRAPRLETAHPVYAVDTPYPLPVVIAGPALPGQLVTNLDGEQVAARKGAHLAGLPGLGEFGVMMDLEYATRTATEPLSPRLAQVWLADGTPPEVVERLEQEGLVVTGEQTVTDLVASLDQSGAALALRFFLLAGGGAALVGILALALVVAVDRRGWARSMGQLRLQGLAGRTTSRAARWSYGGIVLAAVVAGALAAGAAWLAARDRLPLGVDNSVLPPWPQWPPVLVPWAVVVVVLLVAAGIGAAAARQRSDLRMEGRG